MGRFIIIRILQTLIALLGVSIVVFALSRATGDPAMLMLPTEATLEDIALVRQDLGLDKPLYEQYWMFLNDLGHGDLGKSIISKRAVTELIGERFPYTLSLGLTSIVLGVIVAVFLGVTAASKFGTWMDGGVKLLAIIGQAMPNFWLAIVAIYIFAVQLRWLPTSGTGTPAHYVLPVLTMTFFMLPILMRLTRSSMLDVLGSEYIKLARIKGLSERLVIWKHALRNAIIPLLTAAGITFATIITGAIIIETVFAWPGIGRLSYEAVLARDFPVIQGTVLLVAVIVLGVNLLVDILYAYVDPRIRY